MKHTIRAVSLLALCYAASAATVVIEPAVSVTSAGSSVTVAVQVTNVVDLYAYQFDVSFNPTVLSAADITEGAFLPGGGSTFFLPGTIDNVAGTVTFIGGSLEGPSPGVSGSGTVVNLMFNGSGFGASSVSLSNVLLLDSVAADIAADIQDGSVMVVPEPGSVMLIGSGLLVGLVARIRRAR